MTLVYQNSVLQAQENLLGQQRAESQSFVSNVYPGLAEYMGLELSEDVIRQNMPEYLVQQNRTTAMVRPPRPPPPQVKDF